MDEDSSFDPQDNDFNTVTLSASDNLPLVPRVRADPSNEIRTYFDGVYPFSPYVRRLERPEAFELFTRYLRSRVQTDLDDFNTTFERSRQFLTEAKNEMHTVTKEISMELRSAFRAASVLRTERAQAALFLVPRAMKVIARRIDAWFDALEYLQTEIYPQFHLWIAGLSLAATSLRMAASAVNRYRNPAYVRKQRISTAFIESVRPLLQTAALVQELLNILRGESRRQCRSMQQRARLSRRMIQAARETAMEAFNGASFTQRQRVIAAFQRAMHLTKLETIMEPHNVVLSGTTLLTELITSLYDE